MPTSTRAGSPVTFEVRETGKYGKGVFAREPISQGYLIHVLNGEEISGTVCDQLIADGVLSNDDPLQVDEDSYYILDEVSRSFNHSCMPNAGLKEKSTLFALRDISVDEEITYDYSATVDPKNFTFTTMTNCQCGTDQCRKTLGNVLTIPLSQLRYYHQMGALQDYIMQSLSRDSLISW